MVYLFFHIKASKKLNLLLQAAIVTNLLQMGFTNCPYVGHTWSVPNPQNFSVIPNCGFCGIFAEAEGLALSKTVTPFNAKILRQARLKWAMRTERRPGEQLVGALFFEWKTKAEYKGCDPPIIQDCFGIYYSLSSENSFQSPLFVLLSQRGKNFLCIRSITRIFRLANLFLHFFTIPP